MRKLRGVGALHAGATTDGERAAAAKAMRRVAKKLARVRAVDPIRLGCAVHVRSLGVAEPQPEEEAVEMPSDRELCVRLGWWRDGHWTEGELRTWAAHLVDRLVLPARHDDEGACCGEVLLQLSDATVRFARTDVADVEAFVRHQDWYAWFAFLERRAAG